MLGRERRVIGDRQFMPGIKVGRLQTVFPIATISGKIVLSLAQ